VRVDMTLYEITDILLSCAIIGLLLIERDDDNW
jgi:hypothetical protein